MTFGLTQNFEAKIRPRTTDTSAHGDRAQPDPAAAEHQHDAARRTTSSERAMRSRRAAPRCAGVTTEHMGLLAELRPAARVRFREQYSLFQGSTLSDTAKFTPILTSVSASFTIGRDQNPLTVFARLFGKAVPPRHRRLRIRAPIRCARARMTRRRSARGAAGRGQLPAPVIDSSFRRRRDGRRRSVQSIEPSTADGTPTSSISTRALRCEQIAGTNPFLLDACLAHANGVSRRPIRR